jgi:hypothetical protein
MAKWVMVDGQKAEGGLRGSGKNLHEENEDLFQSGVHRM